MKWTDPLTDAELNKLARRLKRAYAETATRTGNGGILDDLSGLQIDILKQARRNHNAKILEH